MGRIVRMIIGLLLLASAVYADNWLIAIIGILFLIQAIFRLGEQGLNSYDEQQEYRDTPVNLDDLEDIPYEEVV